MRDWAGGLAELIQEYLDNNWDEILDGSLSASMDCRNEVHVTLTPDDGAPAINFCVIVNEIP